MAYQDLSYNEKRIEDAMDAAARLAIRPGQDSLEFTKSGLAEEMGFARSYLAKIFPDKEPSEIRRLLVKRHFDQCLDAALAYSFVWPETNKEWPSCWSGLISHLWAAETDYRRMRRHRGMLRLSLSMTPNPAFRWLNCVQVVAFNMVQEAAPAHFWCDSRHVANAIDAAVGILFPRCQGFGCSCPGMKGGGLPPPSQGCSRVPHGQTLGLNPPPTRERHTSPEAQSRPSVWHCLHPKRMKSRCLKTALNTRPSRHLSKFRGVVRPIRIHGLWDVDHHLKPFRSQPLGQREGRSLAGE